jgi:hypothetical protein
MKSEEGTIFLSYAREDEGIATRLFNDLSGAGLNVWFDKVSLRPGQRWKPEIKRAITQCRYFLALLSSNSVSKKGYVQKELYEALELLDEYPESETFIVPVRVEDCEPSHLRLHDIHWVDLFPSYEEGIKKLLFVFSPKQTQMTVVILQEANEVEVANTIDVANASQVSFKFTLHPDIIQFDKSVNELPNGAFDFDNVIDNLIKQQKTIQELLPHKPIFVTSLPYSDKKLVDEFRGKSLSDELSQCYFHEIYEHPLGNVALISTFIWDHLPPNKNIDLPKSPSGRRVLQPYLLFEFAAIALDPLADLPFHEETRGCPFDYCNNVREIDESFRAKRLCAEHEDFLREQVAKARLTKEQMDSAISLFNRAFGKVV